MAHEPVPITTEQLESWQGRQDYEAWLSTYAGGGPSVETIAQIEAARAAQAAITEEQWQGLIAAAPPASTSTIPSGGPVVGTSIGGTGEGVLGYAGYAPASYIQGPAIQAPEAGGYIQAPYTEASAIPFEGLSDPFVNLALMALLFL
jgi:hypothetical protein